MFPKLIILFCFIKLALTQYYAPYSPRQSYFYDYERSPDYYQNDDEGCPEIDDGNRGKSIYLEVGFRHQVRPTFPNNEIILISTEEGLLPTGTWSSPLTVKLRQKLELETPTVCPALEIEVIFRYKPNCFLMWDEFPLPKHRQFHHPRDFTFVYAKCLDMDDPEEVDNPNRIFTVTPYTIKCNHPTCVKYKVCPFKNTSCEEPAVAMSAFGGHSQFNIIGW